VLRGETTNTNVIVLDPIMIYYKQGMLTITPPECFPP